MCLKCDFCFANKNSWRQLFVGLVKTWNTDTDSEAWVVYGCRDNRKHLPMSRKRNEKQRQNEEKKEEK